MIPLGTLNELSFTYTAQQGKLHVSKGNNVFLVGNKRNSLYVFNSHVYVNDVIIFGYANAACTSKTNLSNVRHLRLAHMSEKGMQLLSKQGLLLCAPVNSLGFCEPCVLSKQHI